MNKQSKLFWISFGVTIVWIIFMRPYTPTNIVQFEFAKTTSVAAQIMNDWGPDGITKAATSIYLDFVFIIFYCFSIMFGCKVSASYSKQEILIKIGTLLSWAIWFAGLCDVIENIAMLKTLSTINSSTTVIAFYFAAAKFFIVVASLLFVLLSSVVGLFKKSS